jgi:hypothetical protein
VSASFLSALDRLPRGGHRLDPAAQPAPGHVKEEFIGDEEANRLRSRAARDWT